METEREIFETGSKSEESMAHQETQTAISPRGGIGRAAIFAAALLFAAIGGCSSPEEKVERYTASGLQYLEQGDLGRANIQFQNALKIDETHVPALIGLAEILEQRRDFRAMFGALQRVARLDPDNVDATIKLGKLYLIGSDERQALEYADKALALAPDNVDGLALKAAVSLRLGDEVNAVELAQKALALDPGNAEAVAVIAAERANAGDNESALSAVEEALEKNKDAAVLHLLRLQILSNLGRRNELRDGYEQLVALYPETVAYRQLYANMLLDSEEYSAAREQLVELARIQPGKVDPILDVVRMDNRIGGLDAATQTFKGYVEAQPDNTELRFMFGHFLRQAGDLAGAEAVYDSLAARKSEEGDYLRARNDVAAIRLMEGKNDEAKAIIDEILAKDSSNPDALLKRAGLKIDAKDYDSAIADLRTVVDAKPDLVPAKLLMASAFEGKGDIAFATSQMAQAMETSNNSGETARLFAGFLMRHDDRARAEQVLLDSLSTHPREIETLKLLASIRLIRQDWRGAEEAAKLIEKINAEEPVVNRILGVARTGLEDYSGAIEAFTAANEAAPLAARPLATLVAAYVREGRTQEAEKMLSNMIESNEDDYVSRVLLANVLGAENRRQEKEATLRAAIEAAPQRPEAVEALYRVLIAEKRFGEAEKLLDARIAAAPDVDAFKVLRADLLMATDRRGEALEVYADILTRRPDDLLVSNNYASLLLEEKDDAASLGRALAVARAFEGGSNPYFLDTLGWAQYRNGEVDNAIATLEKAVKFADNLAEAHYHLGAVYLNAGRAEEGRASLERALSLTPEANFADKARALLAGQ